MRARLYRGLLRRLQAWHMSTCPTLSRLTATQPAQANYSSPATLSASSLSKGVTLPGPDLTRASIVEETKELAANELQWMLEYARQSRRGALLKPNDVWNTLISMVRRRVRDNEPLAYILGSQPFGTLEITVRPPLLIPRPETEEWTLEVVRRLEKKEGLSKKYTDNFRVLDMCCGTGCIGLTIAQSLAKDLHGTQAEIHLMDKSPEAIETVKENMTSNGLDFTQQGQNPLRIKIATLDLISPHASTGLLEKSGNKGFDLIVCNPPYIPTEEYNHLDPSVREWEDRNALCGDVSSNDGLDFYRRFAEILTNSEGIVKRRNKGTSDTRHALPSIVFEVGKGQHQQVEAILREIRLASSDEPLFSIVETWNDYRSVGRAVVGYTS
ncbi:unnamed protein product [Sympodiomycopsis kandeliae]